ncbi:Lnb N-terminal periplasmic domain-containing protein [Psychrobacter sp. 1U2]|uniref:Lnb N-terminal periplasmic domain-containing protein n=1 Tax=Psychrobacter sp. 1U2 TaxID=3453577 RepID=UPI003F44BACC
MSINPNLKAVADHSKYLTKSARLPLAVAGLLLSAQVPAFLPTPSSVVEADALLADAAIKDNTIASATTAPAPTSSHSPLAATTLNPSLATKASNANTLVTDEQNKHSNLQAEQLLATWRQQAAAQNLAQHTTWRRLLYFLDDKKGLFSQAKNQSTIDDPSFFLTRNGHKDSAVELDATLVALAKQIATPNQVAAATNDSVICRFPARVNWLAEQLDIDKSSLQADCPELKEWMAMLAPEQLSIMFAEEYLDNPISAFAHTLLRIDSKASAADFSQINHAYALNDTVDGDPDDPFVLYAIKSISGGYDNRIEIDPYPEKLAKYLKDDERDTWTYRLDLTPSEVQQIIAHVWETKNLEIPYYFTTDNCASEILRLIDVVRPQQGLLSQLPYVVVPADVVNLLNDEKLLATSHYTPADSSVRQAQLNQAKLSAKLGYTSISKDELNNIKSETANSASSMSADEQTLPMLPIATADNNPLDRHRLQRAHVGAGQRGDNAYIEVGIRAGFHDTLDRPSGYPQFFDLEGLKASLRVYDTEDDDANNDRVELQNFTLFRGRSFNPDNAAKKGQTWGASIEATQINDGSQQDGAAHLVGSATFEYGKSWVFGQPPAMTAATDAGRLTGEMPQQLCYALATGALQGGRGINKGFRVGAGINAGCRYQLNNRLRLQAQLQLPYWYHGDSSLSEVQANYWQPISTIGVQYDIDKNQALRIKASYDWQDRVEDNEDIQLSYMRYF